MIFRADLNEPSQYESGIDAKEIERGIKWMRANKRSHFISEGKIDILEDVLKAKL